MTRNSWKARLLYGLVLWFSGAAHHEIVQNVSNTPEGMFVFHMSAAATDYMLLMCASSVLCGRLVDDMQCMCFMSMAINALGWVLYMAYAPPVYFEMAIGVLGYVQYARLFTLGFHGSDRVGESIFRGHAAISQELHYEKAQR